MTTDHDVRVLAYPDSMHRVLFRDRITMIPGDLHDPVSLDEALEGVEIVYHAALRVPPPNVREDEMRLVNAEGTRRLAEACAGRVGRLALISSNNVYQPHREHHRWPVLDDAPREPHGTQQQHLLGESLIAAEDAVAEIGERGGFDYTILRPTVIAGRKCPFIEQMVLGLLRNPGSAEFHARMWDVMQWTHGTDLASAAMLAAESDAGKGQRFLVAGREPITAFDVLSEIWEIMNVGREGNPYAEGAARHRPGRRKFETRKLDALGWEPVISVRRCVEEVLGRLEFFSAASIELPTYMTA